jgi:hypothetical protein
LYIKGAVGGNLTDKIFGKRFVAWELNSALSRGKRFEFISDRFQAV